jgi:hypothetical protein
VTALAVAALAAALATPAASATGPSFAVGRGGGNVVPLDARIRTVTQRGSCNERFIRVYDALSAAGSAL